MGPRPPQETQDHFYGGLREGLSGPYLLSKNEYHTQRGPIQPRWGEDPRALFTLRESRRGGHELCEHGSDRRETSATRVSDDLEFLIF